MPITNIESVTIKNFFSIDDIKLKNLKDKKEIYIVGENGDGKSLLLQAIAIALVGVQDGDVFDFMKGQKNYTLSLLDSKGKEYDHQPHEYYKHIFAYGAARNNYCQMKEDATGYLTLFNSEYDLKNPLKWLQYLDYREKSGKRNIISVGRAKEILQDLLGSEIEIDISPDKVRFMQKGSEATFRQLSSGYQGVIILACDLLSRLALNQPEVDKMEEFEGIVLIDEMELHLHPKWQYHFMKKLRDAFPLIQFIVTTHSPTVILGASKEAVFYKVYKEDGIVNISNQLRNEGYTYNSVISSPLFDLEEIASRSFTKSVSSSDYVYDKIHEVISTKIKNNINVDEEELMNLIDKELEAL